MNRREFFSFAAVGAVGLQQPSAKNERLDELIAKLEDIIKEEIPDVTKVTVKYDPKNAEVPLMILAFRFSDQSLSSA